MKRKLGEGLAPSGIVVQPLGAFDHAHVHSSTITQLLGNKKNNIYFTFKSVSTLATATQILQVSTTSISLLQASI